MITIYGTPWCSYCKKAVVLCKNNGIVHEYKTVDEDISKEMLEALVGSPIQTVPVIFEYSNGFSELIGGYDQLNEKIKRMNAND